MRQIPEGAAYYYVIMRKLFWYARIPAHLCEECFGAIYPGGGPPFVSFDSVKKHVAPGEHVECAGCPKD